MTDEQLVAKKLSFIETCLKELELLAKPDAIETEVKERRFIEHTLQICVHAAQDVREDPAPPSKYATEPVPYPPDQAVLRGLRKTPSERFQSAVEFRHEVWSPSLW